MQRRAGGVANRQIEVARTKGQNGSSGVGRTLPGSDQKNSLALEKAGNLNHDFAPSTRSVKSIMTAKNSLFSPLRWEDERKRSSVAERVRGAAVL